LSAQRRELNLLSLYEQQRERNQRDRQRLLDIAAVYTMFFNRNNNTIDGNLGYIKQGLTDNVRVKDGMAMDRLTVCIVDRPRCAEILLTAKRDTEIRVI